MNFLIENTSRTLGITSRDVTKKLYLGKTSANANQVSDFTTMSWFLLAMSSSSYGGALPLSKIEVAHDSSIIRNI